MKDGLNEDGMGKIVFVPIVQTSTITRSFNRAFAFDLVSTICVESCGH